MSLTVHFSLLRNCIRSLYPVRLLKQHAGFLSGKLFDPRSNEEGHFMTGLQTPSWPKPVSGSRLPGIQLWTHQTSELDRPGTVLIFDVETTGYPHRDNRIIEIAIRDLSGGKNCTFETLVNPERDVPKNVSKLNGIDTDLVCRPDIPRFSDLLPVLLAYIRSRQVPGKPIMWVGHNAKHFDVPFLAEEFRRCSVEIPADWIFVDSLPLARKVVKSEVKPAGEKRRLTNLEALRKHYGIHSKGTAHRAMKDVIVLSQVMQKITFDLKLTYEGLMNESISASDCRKLS